MTSLRRVPGTLLVLAIFALAGVMLVPAALHLQRYVITTGSMTGTYDPGSVVYDRMVDVKDLKVGDVITYNPPPSAQVPGLVTHRIIAIGRDGAGNEKIQTKGDYNQHQDPWTFAPNQPKMAVVVASLPWIGRVFAFLNTHNGRLLIFGLPGLLIALSVLASMWAEAGEAQRAEEATEATA